MHDMLNDPNAAKYRCGWFSAMVAKKSQVTKSVMVTRAFLFRFVSDNSNLANIETEGKEGNWMEKSLITSIN